MLKWKPIMATVAVLALCALPAGADLWDNPKVAEKLGLSEEQTDQLQNVCLQQRKARIQRRADQQNLQIELQELWKSDKLDEGKILSKIREQAQLREDAEVERAKTRIQMHGILTPEQRKKVKAFMRQGIAKRRQARGQQGQQGRQRGLQGPPQGRWQPGRGRPGQSPQGWGHPGMQPGAGPGWGAPQQGRGQQRGPRQWGALDAPEEFPGAFDEAYEVANFEPAPDLLDDLSLLEE